MQENIFSNFLKESVEKGSEDYQGGVEENSDFDSEDEEAEKKIVSCYQKAKQADCDLSKKIFQKIPIHMKKRLE